MNKIVEILKAYEYKTNEYESKECIHYEGEECTLVEFVISGHIRISSFDSNGTELVYKDLRKGDCYGNNLVFSSNHIYRGNVISLESSKTIALTKDEYLNLMSSNKEFLEAMLIYQAEDSKILNQTIKMISSSSSEEKLLYLLKVSGNSIKVASITDLAKKLNMSREAASRLVHRLVRQGKIAYKEKQLIKR